MRKVVINRMKSIVGCLGKVSIYTSDELGEWDEITPDKCKFIDKIKNGSSLEFEINDNEIIIIAAYDNMGAFMVTDYIFVPQGKDDIEIAGKVKLNPSRGNPFIFLK